MTRRMRFAQYSTYGSPEVLELVDGADPVPFGAEVLVEIRAAGVNPFEQSRASLIGAVGSMLQAGARDGLLREDVDPADVLAGLNGAALVAGAPEQREQADRLLDLLMDGLRYRR